MRTTLLLALCCLLSISLFAQPPAPDFTVTTSSGSQFQLYEDHLNQGRAVLVKFFFTTCPPCNDMAPLMEPFYQEWGGNGGAAEFISLSIMPWDNNNNVANYKNQYGQTFPGAGANGGSTDAVDLLADGTYGSLLGTPAFCVIAPDGTVTWNPMGGNFNATINALDQALRGTGITKPALPTTLSGRVLTPDLAPVKGVKIFLEEDDSQSGYTNANGDFNFDGAMVARDDYHLIAEKDSNYVNGVSILDVIQVRKHILTIETLDTPYKLLAADLNGDGSISTLDIIRMMKIIQSVASGSAGSNSWLMIPAGYTFQNPTSPWAEVYAGDFYRKAISSSSTSNHIWFAIKMGDLNSNADPQE